MGLSWEETEAAAVNRQRLASECDRMRLRELIRLGEHFVGCTVFLAAQNGRMACRL